MSEPDYLNNDVYLADYLATAKQSLEEDDKPALLRAMHQCLIMKKPLPEWLRLAFIEAYKSGAGFKIRSWDEVFGPPQEDGTHLERRRKHSELRYPIALQIALRGPGEAVDDLLAKIGPDLGVSAGTARAIYYEHGGKELHETLEPILPWLNSRKANSEKK